jgi:hypothetical protein
VTAQIIPLPTTIDQLNKHVQTVTKQFQSVRNPSELDAATQSENMPAFLLNFHFATKVNLSRMGLEQAIHIPIQISERDGGRKSIFFLNQNEEVLAGIYVTSEGIAQRFVKRVTGSTFPAQTGDTYSTRIINQAGDLLFESREQLKTLNDDPSSGRFLPISNIDNAKELNAAAPAGVSRCHLFSLLNYEPAW